MSETYSNYYKKFHNHEGIRPDSYLDVTFDVDNLQAKVEKLEAEKSWLIEYSMSASCSPRGLIEFEMARDLSTCP